MKAVFVSLASVAALPLLEAQQVQGDASLLPSEPELSTEETHIRAGIVLLGMLCNTLAKVSDHESAQAAVPVIVRITRELHAWGQGTNALPPLSEELKEEYELRYLPAIRRLNDHLRVQGERLAASEYFGCQDLSTALVSLYVSSQQ